MTESWCVGMFFKGNKSHNFSFYNSNSFLMFHLYHFLWEYKRVLGQHFKVSIIVIFENKKMII